MKLIQEVSNQKFRRGSTLVLALTLCGLGTLGVVATVSIVQARGMEAERASDDTARWTRLQNSRSLARQVIYRKYLTADTGPSGVEGYSLPDNWGEIAVRGFSSPPLSSTAERTSKTGAVPYESFSMDLDVGLSDGTYLDEYQVQMKSASPILSGDLLIVQRPLEDDSDSTKIKGDLIVRGRSVIHGLDDSGKDSQFKSERLLNRGEGIEDSKITGIDGSLDEGENFGYATKASSDLGDDVLLDGRVRVIENDDTPHNAYLSKIIASGNTSELDGDLPFAKGIGPDTRPGDLIDATLISLLAGPVIDWELIVNALSAEIPLSSAVLIALIETEPPAGILRNLLVANAPLPGDVLGLVERDKTLNQAMKDQILESTPHIARSDGKGNVIILPTASIASHIRVKNAKKVIFKGESDPSILAASEAYDAVVVVIQQKDSDSNELEEIEFQEQNHRRLIVAVQQESREEIKMEFTGSSAFPDWRMLLELESTPVEIKAEDVSGVQIIGGIRTDQDLDVKDGTVTLKRETDPGNLRILASRDGWIEIYRK